MIEDPNNPANSLFAAYKNGSIQIQPMVECIGQVLVPVPRRAEIFKNVRLPQGSQPYRSTRWLLGGIATLILACELQQENVRLNAHELGRALTSLGLTDRKRTNAGFVMWLDLRARKRIHQLAHDHGIAQESQFQAAGFDNNCELCKNPEASNPGSAETKEDTGIDPKRK